MQQFRDLGVREVITINSILSAYHKISVSCYMQTGEFMCESVHAEEALHGYGQWAVYDDLLQLRINNGAWLSWKVQMIQYSNGKYAGTHQKRVCYVRDAVPRHDSR